MKKVISALPALLLGIALSFACGVAEAAGPGNPFLWAPGTSNNGLYASRLTLMTTEMNTLTNGSVIISSVNGTSGVFSNSNTGQALVGTVSFVSGASGPTCAAGGNIAGWFLQSLDGTTFEPTAAVPARAPDFVVALPVAAITSNTFNSGVIPLPALKFKVLVQNNCGSSLSATGNIIYVGPQTPIY